jgi:alkylhydroperoxidase family enzyme
VTADVSESKTRVTNHEEPRRDNPHCPPRTPYGEPEAAQLRTMMPAGVPPIALFRTFATNLSMAQAMGEWGRYELSRALSISLRHREIVIDRTCAGCGCEYEWGVHVAFFAEKADLTAAQITSLTHGEADDACWLDERDRLVIELVDQLQHHSVIDDELWCRLRGLFTESQLLDLTMLCGWYHAISFTARSAGVPLEEWAPTFESVRSLPPGEAA